MAGSSDVFILNNVGMETDIPHSALTLQSVVFFAFWSEQFDDLYGILVEVSDFLVFLAAEPY
ncbi:MAG: hypothetical protein QFX31_08525, partial [Methanothrix sp.]|uniref:hypothetical protein n=1 Tax=Methanothrix sp. TaxID=90426 RepID=UPI0032AFF843|nr:hypothetical protein [Methanothrix sp.]